MRRSRCCRKWRRTTDAFWRAGRASFRSWRAAWRGTRIIPAREFFAGIMTTALAEDELITEVRLPLLSPQTRFGFYEFNRRAGDFALAMALAVHRVENGRMAEPRLAVGGAETHARRMAQAEQALA